MGLSTIQVRFRFTAPSFASGGTPPINRWFGVGENGPELMRLVGPSQDMNHQQSQSLGNGGGVGIHMENFAPSCGDIGHYSPNQVSHMFEDALMSLLNTT
jgi:hypothetical protein